MQKVYNKKFFKICKYLNMFNEVYQLLINSPLMREKTELLFNFLVD